MDKTIIIRSTWDRLRYAIIFETILVLLLGFIFAVLTGRNVLNTGGLAVTLSAIALLVNLVYNYIFDQLDVANGRVPTERSRRWRIIHAVGFEFTLTIISLPIIMWWLDWGFLQALFFDIAAVAAVVVYTYFFTLSYDALFPIPQAG